jgi:hypothetical protein
VLERRLAFDQEEERGRVVEVFVARHSSGASQTRPESKNAIAPPPGRSDFLAAVIHSTDSRYERKMDRERHLSIYIYILFIGIYIAQQEPAGPAAPALLLFMYPHCSRQELPQVYRSAELSGK